MILDFIHRDTIPPVPTLNSWLIRRFFRLVHGFNQSLPLFHPDESNSMIIFFWKEAANSERAKEILDKFLIVRMFIEDFILLLGM
jgi:hypothetical protein